jgi:large subunit ribosomal protein L6
MSRIGKKPIKVPEKVKVEVSGRTVKVTGPLGVLEGIIPAGVTIKQEGDTITLGEPELNRQNKGFQGLMRALLANMVNGVTKGFERTIEITGVGYKAEQKGDKLVLALGYTHPCEVTLPKNIKAKIDKGTVVTISGPDKQVVNQIAATLRAFKKPEPYKGKGVKYSDETIIRKVGKTGAK